MRISPAKNHFQHAQAAQRQSIDAPVRADATAYELMLAKLAEDRRRLHDIQSIERRAEVKRELLPDYEAWVGGALEGDHGVQDDVLMTIMVWCIDVGDLAGALKIARYAIKHKLAMPDQYKRSTGCLVAEEFADYALRLDAIAPEITGRLQEANDLTVTEDMPDQVRAKLLKAIGHGLLQAADAVDKESRPAYLQSALDHFKHAIGLHEKVGVKKDIERLEREIKNSASA
jgi:hypothetical protein